MTTYTNESLGIAIDINENGSGIKRTTRPRTESMLPNDEVEKWFEKTYKEHFKKERDYSI